MSRLKVLVCCGAGMGSSQMLKMTAEKVFRELEIDADIHHCAIDEARSAARNYDLILCNQRFVDTFPGGTKVIGLQNILSKAEIKEKLIKNNIGEK
ncbi:PTS sugar transporter subunit IIB [Peptoniphilaceae bacterium SGI.137]|nr:PTS sugar transporter subunit IIB [Peptoniphilaceae bacterium]MDY3987576.1 PTS sugar transporter subunit IIB [Peptoniphilaceae bacterium]MDY5842048.1 PTS sugar transporter subunit IIB [Peptoniphilaceae bacterium]